jgi:hypothetical protein
MQIALHAPTNALIQINSDRRWLVFGTGRSALIKPL